MNDIEKMSSDMKKVAVLRAKQESASNTRRILNERRAMLLGIPVEQLTAHPALVPVNTLDDNGDGQDNLLPRDQWPVGLVVKIEPWTDMSEPSYKLYFFIDEDEPVSEVTVAPGFTAFDHPVPVVDYQYDHGPHVLGWYSQGQDTGNTIDGPPLDFFIDNEDPNLGQQPDPILLPADLPDGDLTQEYLEQKGGISLTLPPFADSRPGDKFDIWINDNMVLDDQDATAPFTFLLDKTKFEAVPEGIISLSYTIVDRAGNRTVQALPQTLRFVKSPAPDMRPPLIPEGPEISLTDARDGVTVLHDYDTPMEGDLITVHWQNIIQDSYYIEQASSVDVSLKDVSTPGEKYTATVSYEINRRGKVYFSPDATVEVDIEDVGPVNPGEPDIVNPNLTPLTLTSSTAQTNAIVPADKDQPANMTVPLYTPINVGEIVNVYYGAAGNSVQEVELTQADITANQIVVVLPWTMIDAQGNGTIEAFYRIYPKGKPENFQQSPMTDILVTVHNLQDLPVCVFSNREEAYNIINCNVEPWINGVDIEMTYEFEADDEITINWVLDKTWPPVDQVIVPNDPLEESRTNFSHRVTVAEASRGVVTFNVWWGEHLELLTEGSIVVQWSMKRGEVTGISPPQFVRYNRHRPSGGRPVCPP